MFFKLFILFVVMPILEISLLLEVGEAIGGWTTLFIVILTAIIGAQLVKAQGLAALAEIKQKTAMGELPAESITEGIMILIAGVLLVTPGFITDALGLLMTIPLTRKPFAQILVRQLGQQIKTGHFTYQNHSGFHSHSQFRQSSHAPFESERSDKHEQGTVIEGEFERKDEDKNLK